MALAELIGKLKSKKTQATKTAFGHYIELVKRLASGSECDADECVHVLDANSVDESRLERDVNLQTQRNQWHAQMLQNRQAVQDRVQAERELQAAQAKLQEALAKLQPAVDSAFDRLADANHAALVTHGAEAWLCEHILDAELLEREQAVSRQLGVVSQELNPLLQDRHNKQHSLGNAEFNLSRLQTREAGDWVPAGIVQFFNQNSDIRALLERVSDLQSQIQQLNAAIAPRQAEQNRLRAELDSIHQRKLEP